MTLPPGLIVDSVASGWEHRYTPEAPGNPAPIPTTPSILHLPEVSEGWAWNAAPHPLQPAFHS